MINRLCKNIDLVLWVAAFVFYLSNLFKYIFGNTYHQIEVMFSVIEIPLYFLIILGISLFKLEDIKLKHAATMASLAVIISVPRLYYYLYDFIVSEVKFFNLITFKINTFQSLQIFALAMICAALLFAWKYEIQKKITKPLFVILSICYCLFVYVIHVQFVQQGLKHLHQLQAQQHLNLLPTMTEFKAFSNYCLERNLTCSLVEEKDLSKKIEHLKTHGKLVHSYTTEQIITAFEQSKDYLMIHQTEITKPDNHDVLGSIFILFKLEGKVAYILDNSQIEESMLRHIKYFAVFQLIFLIIWFGGFHYLNRKHLKIILNKKVES